MTEGRILAVTILAGLVVGVTASAVRPGAGWAVALAAASLAVAATAPGRRRLILGVVVGASAMAHGAGARERVLGARLGSWVDLRSEGGRVPHPVIVEGTLRGDAERSDTGARLAIDVHSIEDANGRVVVGGRAQVFVGGALSSESLEAWTGGRTIRAPMTLRRPHVARNPGGSSEEWQALIRRFDVSGHIKSAMLISVAPAAWWHEAAAAVRASIRRRTAALFPAPSDQTAAVVIAILIGDRSGLDPGLERRLQVAGTYHVIAISGGNVALLTALSFFGMRLVFRSYRWASGLTIAVVILYGWVAGGEPSVSRAVTAAVIYLACGWFGLVPAVLDVLVVVALLLALQDPLTVVDAGAWLSFGATAGIIVYAGRFAAWHAGLPAPVSFWRPAGVWMLGFAGATAAADLALLPVQASLFSRVGVAGLVLNLIAIPMIAVVQIAGAIAIALVGLSTSLASMAAVIASAAVSAIAESARLTEVLPWLSWRVPAPPAAVIVCYYATWLIWLSSLPGLRRRWVATAGAASLVVIVFAPATFLRQPGAGRLRMTMVDVGQGEALILQLPGGHALAVDAGGAGARFDAGDRVVTPVLWASGLRRLDWLLFTHADIDHIGGAGALAATFRPREIWEGVPVPSDPARTALAAYARRTGAVWRSLYRGHGFTTGGVTVDVLHPAPPDWERPRVRNDDSVVLRVRHGIVELLLTGDVSRETEAQLLDGMTLSPLRVLKVAHHGSRTSTSAAFVRRYAPQVALVSAGQGNPFGHPAGEVVDRLRGSGAMIFRTDRDGAIILESDGRGVEIGAMSGRRWRLGATRPP